MTDYVRDGHLIVMRPQIDSLPNLFPLLLKIINKKLYSDTDNFDFVIFDFIFGLKSPFSISFTIESSRHSFLDLPKV